MVIVTSAVTFEQHQAENERDATDCWSRFPWHVVLVLGAVQVLSKIIEANNTLTKTLRPSSWMQQSPLTVQIVLAVVAALLSEAMNNESLSRMLLPLTIHAAVSTRMHPIYYAIPVVVAASSNLIMPITLPLVILHEVAEVPLRHLVLAGLVLKTALLSTLIISMNTTAQYIFYISPAVRALNSTSPASRNQAPHY
ncbi:sodium-dependent high-affinity dicarboxylate transporter 2-like [Rhipicephalus microplus]|uniref:sodium-dependent high-affinity dicarboxylate transporter 2-like n=1 Tax=Rhipicephalus microplus TaxID=6941 RepID=UPI003F6C72C7